MTQEPARVRRALLVAAAFLLPGAAAHAQFTTVPAPAVYALRNVTVVQADGTQRSGMNVVVRGSFIEAVGRDAAIPAGAQVLDGDSLFVYPGIVDAMGSVGYEFPRDSINRETARSWDPPRALQGFMPARRVSQFLEPSEKELSDLRKKGVVAVAVHPADMIMPGQGALLLLRNAADEPQRMVIDPSLGAVLTLRTARGAYPGTGMGLMAFYRQTFLDARRLAQIAQTADSDPRILTPAFDPDYAVVQQVLAGTIPVYFAANSAEEIMTVLQLADEFGFKPTIMGGGEAWKVASELKARNIPVLVSLDYPEPRQWKPADAKPDSAAKDSASEKKPADPRGPLPSALREQKMFEELYANPGRLAAAGVRFALTSGGGEADIRTAMKKPLEFGLSEADALRAITATPAQILGVPGLGSVAEDLPATFVVTKKPMFEKGAKVMYTFVEGTLEKTATPADDDSPSGRRGRPDTGTSEGGAR